MVTSNISIVLSLSLAFFLVLPTKANLTGIVSFTFNDFSKGKPNLILQGETVSSWSGELWLTKVGSNDVPTLQSLGHAFYAAPIQIWDIKMGTVAIWTTSFTFKISMPNKYIADGLAFFLALVGSQPQSNREYLSLFSNTTISVQTMAVEFDTFSKKKWDPTESHIGIDVNLI